MRIARVRVKDKVYLARKDRDQYALLLEESSHPAHDVLREALAMNLDLSGTPIKTIPVVDQVLAPICNPNKIIAAGLNYRDHAIESGMEIPLTPVFFSKFPTCIVGPDDHIEYTDQNSKEVDYEVELAIVIGKESRNISKEESANAILGITIANDVSARDAQFADKQWVRGKSFDTFLPLGPEIVTLNEIEDVSNLNIWCTVDGKKLQNGSTRELIFNIFQLVAYVSRFMTLVPGDIILTGTPPGVGFARKPPVFLTNNTTVECGIEGLGVLKNSVRVRPDITKEWL